MSALVKNARRYSRSEGKREGSQHSHRLRRMSGASTYGLFGREGRQRLSTSLSQMWAIFRTACRKLGRKLEWSWRRRRPANRAVCSLGTQEEEEEKAEEEVKIGPRPPLCGVDSLQLFLRKHRKGGSARRPRAPAFRWSANWDPVVDDCQK